MIRIANELLGYRIGFVRAGHWAVLCLAVMALLQLTAAQGPSTTTVAGTVYLANGEPGSGTLVLSWPAFTTAAGQLITADSMTVTISSNGSVSVSLAPNQGATPAGEYYTAVYYMSDGTTSTQYWVVPVATSATLAQVQAQVMPAAQAVQTVSKAYVDEAIAELAGGAITATGGTLTGPLYLSGPPSQPLQAADKSYVDTSVSQMLPLTGGVLTGPVTATKIGAAYQVDQFSGADIGAKLQGCLSALSSTYGGICDARNFTGSLSMASNVTISVANAAILLPCATITTANQIIVTAGTRNVTLRGCALRGASASSGSAGGTVFAYSGSGAMFQVGDPTYAADTSGFHLDNVVINTTSSTSAAAQGFLAYRTQEINLEGLYLLGNSNQTGVTLDGTGNYTGGTFLDLELSGFGTAVNAIGHQVANAATTDWMNASTFVRLHIDCPTSSGSPMSGTYGINLQQGDGNTFTGGDVEGCATALHLGANAQNNTVIGLRNENSTNQVAADSGSAYNNWITGGTMFTGKLTDNGTRNSFLDTFHRSFNGMNGDWYGSQQDATVINHYRLGTGNGNERGLQDEYQTDYGYRWEIGLGDGTTGEQYYNFTDLLNNIQRVSIGQYLSTTANVVTNVIVNNGGCYTSSTAPVIGFSGGGGSGATATATMAATSSLSCAGGYTVSSIMITSGGSGYTAQPTMSFSGSNQTTAPSAVAEIVTAGSTNNQTVINSAGTGAVVLNGSNNAGTGGVVIGSGGTSETTVATVSNAGNVQFVGTLQVGSTTQSTGTLTVRNNADAEVDYYLWPGLTASQKGSFTYKDWNGNSQWYMVKDASNNWSLNSAVGGLDSFKAYQSTNSGDTYIDASNTSGHIRLNYESGSGAETDIYSNGTLDMKVAGTTTIELPGLAASSGHNCLQVDNSGYLSNTGSACGTGSGSGTVTSVTFTGDGTILSSTPSTAVTTSGTLTASLNTQSANCVLAGPASGSAAAPACRALVVADVPTLNQNSTGYAAGLAGGSLGGLLYQSAANTTAFLSGNAGSTPEFVTSTGTGSSAQAPTLTSSTGSGNVVLAGAPTFTGNTTTYANNSANTDYLILEPGNTGNAEIGALEFASASGTSEWELRDDASYNFHLRNTGATTAADAITGYSGGQTVINSQGTASVAVNNASTSGTGGFVVYEGGSSNYNTAAFTVTSSGAASTAGNFTVGTSGTGNMAVGNHLNQVATNDYAGTCTMSSVTTCTVSLQHSYSSTPICFTQAQSSTSVIANCAVSSNTVTVTAQSSNSLTWGVLVIGNPN